ncbi:MAG: DUF1559 domain-containing protein [Planctomycetota bacterium]|nr:MAG: DUF1559 domain-containing protein [Planctomycetota bacterium]
MTRALAAVVASFGILAVAVLASPAHASEDFDLSYVPGDAIAAVVLHPKQILAAPELRGVPWHLVTSGIQNNYGIDVSQLDLVVGIVRGEIAPDKRPELGFVLHFAEPYDREAVLAKLGKGADETKYGEHTYWQGQAIGAPSFYLADEKTVLLGTDEQVRWMLDPKPADSALAKLLKRLDTHKSAMVVVDLAPLHPLIEQGLAALPPLPEDLQPLLEIPMLIQWTEVSIDVRSGVDLQVTLGGADAEAAQKMESLVQQARELAKRFVEEGLMNWMAAQGGGQMNPAAMQQVQQFVIRMLDALEIRQQGEQVEIAMTNDQEAAAAVGFTTALVLPAVQAAREAARRAQSVNKLQRIGIGMMAYHDVRKSYPPPAIVDKEGTPLLSWRVAILPYLEDENALALYKEFHLDEPWDSEHNKPLAERMPDIYANPNAPSRSETVYLGVAGPGTILGEKVGVPIRRVADGMSKTVLVVEADSDRAVVWSKPDDLHYDPEQPTAGLGNLWQTGFNALFADASIQFLGKDIDPDLLRALFTYRGNEVIDLPR